MDKFKGKYRIPSTRLQNWDYRWSGYYFVTICTENKETYFGEIKDGKMHLSPIGIIADVLWHEIKNHAKNVELDEFIVMPNHVHGILILDNDDFDTVETGHALSLLHQQQPKTIGQQRFQNIGKNSLSSIIGSYKSAVTKHARRLGYDFAWQTRFYDHIIRNEKSYKNIKYYIINNPAKWNDDDLNPGGQNIK